MACVPRRRPGRVEAGEGPGYEELRSSAWHYGTSRQRGWGAARNMAWAPTVRRAPPMGCRPMQFGVRACGRAGPVSGARALAHEGRGKGKSRVRKTVPSCLRFGRSCRRSSRSGDVAVGFGLGSRPKGVVARRRGAGACSGRTGSAAQRATYGWRRIEGAQPHWSVARTPTILLERSSEVHRSASRQLGRPLTSATGPSSA